MLKILTSILILLNPVVGFFTSNNSRVEPKDASLNEAALVFNAEDYRFPLSENMFLASQLIPTYPFRNWNVSNPEISAKIALVFDVSRQKILWQKNGLHEKRPIASLTKLATALAIMENAKLDDVYKVSKKAVEAHGEMGNLRVGEELTVKNLLYALLVESSNDAATALAENISAQGGSAQGGRVVKNLVGLMNQKARELGLVNTFFSDPSGLDPQNYSSAWDLNRLMQEVAKYPELQEIMQTASIDLLSVDGRFNHHLTSTNQLLGRFPEIIGGKTGYTEEAGNCIVLAIKSPDKQGTIIIVIIDSEDRIAEGAALIKWTENAFLW